MQYMKLTEVQRHELMESLAAMKTFLRKTFASLTPQEVQTPALMAPSRPWNRSGTWPTSNAMDSLFASGGCKRKRTLISRTSMERKSRTNATTVHFRSLRAYTASRLRVKLTSRPFRRCRQGLGSAVAHKMVWAPSPSAICLRSCISMTKRTSPKS